MASLTASFCFIYHISSVVSLPFAEAQRFYVTHIVDPTEQDSENKVPRTVLELHNILRSTVFHDQGSPNENCYTDNMPSVPRYFKHIISAYFRAMQKHTKQIGIIFVASLIAKNRKITCEINTTGSPC